MCGFAGYVGPESPEEHQILRRMGIVLSARGPDEEIIFDENNFRMVFRRLAINDLIGGRQPFVTAQGRFVAAVNGEIYNYAELKKRYLGDVTFESQSDCEVVPHLFERMGPDFLDKLNGIYAIAIWDRRERSLFLARDHLGVKPLYYSMVGETLIFASELKALLIHPMAPRIIDWAAMEHVPNPVFPFERPAGRPVATCVRGVEFVDPASYLEWKDGRVRRRRRYWQVPELIEKVEQFGSPDDCVERYAELVADSVKLQLMSDVPISLFLSGGLDSSLIAAIAARLDPLLQAFTLVEPSITQTGDPETAIQVAKHLGMPLQLVRVDEEALRATLPFNLETFEYLIWQMDMPVFEVEFLFKHELHRLSKIQDTNRKVVLLGQGADEFAGGYSALVAANWQTAVELEERSFHIALLGSLGVPSVYRQFLNQQLTHSIAMKLAGTCEPWQYLRFGDLPAYNLWHEDRTAAANGVEARVPFLDHRLVEFLCSIPKRWHRELFFDKEIVRRVASRYLPEVFTRRPKVPLFAMQKGATDLVTALRRGLLESIFEDFSEKYLESQDSMFSKREILLLRKAAGLSNNTYALDLVYRCMAISVFERHCNEAASSEFEPPRLRPLLPPIVCEASDLKTIPQSRSSDSV